MKALRLLPALFLCLGAFAAAAQSALNMQLLSNWRSSPGRFYNDVWGYAANGREYAIIGSNFGTHFVDVTDPTAPALVAEFAGTFQGLNGNISWRDFKTHGHYAYGVADGSARNSLQIFDLSGLPATVTKVYDSNALSTNAHTLAQEGNRLYLVSNGRGNTYKAIDIVDISDPVNPVLLGSLNNAQNVSVHALHVRNDTLYCSNGFNGFMVIDARDPANLQVVTTMTSYPYFGYNHTAWTSGDRKTLLFTDEIPSGMPAKVFDITDISNPVMVSTFSTGTAATPHNCFMLGNIAIVAYYKDGVQVWDLSKPAHPTRLGYYDTYPDNDSTFASYNQPSTYEGAWGAYPYLPSGNILVSDVTYGLFVLSPPYQITARPEPVLKPQLTLYPNPASGRFTVRLPAGTRCISLTLYNALGQPVRTLPLPQGAAEVPVPVEGLAAGIYSVQVSTDKEPLQARVSIR